MALSENTKLAIKTYVYNELAKIDNEGLNRHLSYFLIHRLFYSRNSRPIRLGVDYTKSVVNGSGYFTFNEPK